jgi:hypothetical protein
MEKDIIVLDHISLLKSGDLDVENSIKNVFDAVFSFSTALFNYLFAKKMVVKKKKSRSTENTNLKN